MSAYPPANVVQRQGLTPDEVAELTEAFRLFDTENTGTIDISELRETLSSLGKPQGGLLTSALAALPPGRITLQQLLDAVTANTPPSSGAAAGAGYAAEEEASLRRVFALLSSGGPYVTVGALQSVSRELGDPVPAVELRDMVERADADGDGRVTFEDFYAIMTGKPLR